jgi:hypothetical protein
MALQFYLKWPREGQQYLSRRTLDHLRRGDFLVETEDLRAELKQTTSIVEEWRSAAQGSLAQTGTVDAAVKRPLKTSTQVIPLRPMPRKVRHRPKRRTGGFGS